MKKFIIAISLVVAITIVVFCIWSFVYQDSDLFTVQLTGMEAEEAFFFTLSAKGNFTVDWGDGTVDTINKTDTEQTPYWHIYSKAGNYKVVFDGLATEYNTDYMIRAAISFEDAASKNKITGISGSFGKMFPILNFKDSGAPKFRCTFKDCKGLTGSIPKNLFSGISGSPVEFMFSNTFQGCAGLTDSIPENLFSGIDGLAVGMFADTFDGCTGLTGSIPENLFTGIKGAPAPDMFYNTFGNCKGLTGSIPENLFVGINGSPADCLFTGTFDGCSGLTGSIPENLFSGISGVPAKAMFNATFRGCSGLRGSIPSNLFTKIKGSPAEYIFHSIFSGCSGLTSIGDGLFNGIAGTAQTGMFEKAFEGCTNLTGPSAKSNGKFLYEKWKDASDFDIGGCYQDTKKLSDWDNIPVVWKQPPLDNEGC